MSNPLTGVALAERFIRMLNAFDVVGIDGLIAPRFTFQIGPHVTDRGDFLASVATGSASDPYFRFEPQACEDTESGCGSIRSS